MKVMLMRKADTDTEKGVMPSEDLLKAMADYNERMANAGVFADGQGLRPTREGFRIQFRNGKPTIIQGPFEQESELLAGYSILEVDSLEEALDWARQWPVEDAGGNATLELRRYFELEDFEPGPAIDQHRALGQRPKEMNVHLSFAGNCREAMEFYAELIGGELEGLVTYSDTPTVAEVPAEMQDRIVHASLNLNGRRVMGADMADDCYQQPQGAQVHLDYEDAEQAERVFRALSEGGKEIIPFAETFYAHRFGMTTDRYGIQWMISSRIAHCP